MLLVDALPAVKKYQFTIIWKRRGLCHYRDLSCTKCDWTSSFSTSKDAKPMSSDNGSGGRNPHDVNIRSVIATRE